MMADELDAKIEELCKAKGMTFKPHECPPWEAREGSSPWPPNTAGSESWPKAQALRRKLIAEIEGQPAEADASHRAG
jgi:hypothetical protein